MKFSTADREALVQLLTRLYRDVLDLETTHSLLVGGNDLRPRIEYFHDAIRAFTANTSPSRLSVEYLAYDLSCLRYIQTMPFAAIKPIIRAGSREILKTGNNLPARRNTRPDRESKERLSELYLRYSLLFAALLKPEADRDWQDRSVAIDDTVSELAPVIAELEAFIAGRGNSQRLQDLTDHLHDTGAHQLLTQFLQAANYRSREKTQMLIKLLKDRTSREDETRAQVENAHLQYAMNQLGIYEQGREELKAMAAEGMNLAGKFVEASMTETSRASGRKR